MGRGKPFSQSLSKLVEAGVKKRPIWLSAVEQTKPKFQPIVETKPPRLVYPEDRLRNKYLVRNPHARHIPVNMRAKSIEERHIADRFVSIQLNYMNQQNMSEEDAYHAAETDLRAISQQARKEADITGPLQDMNISDQVARLYLASLKDSKRDQKMFHALLKNSQLND